MSKQYILIADEINISLLGKVMPGLKFLEVEGMNLKDHEGYQLLVNPMPKKEEDAIIPEPEQLPS